MIARWTPTQGPKNTGDMFKLVRWLQTVRNNSSFQQLSILLPSEQLVLQASSAKGVVCKIRNDEKAETSAIQRSGQG